MADVIEILREIGVDKLGVQRLSNVLDGDQKALKGGGVRLAFRCDEVTLGEATIQMTRDALIVWVDTAELDAALARIRARKA